MLQIEIDEIVKSMSCKQSPAPTTPATVLMRQTKDQGIQNAPILYSRNDPELITVIREPDIKIT